MITEFRGEYRWLSNFWPATVFYNGHPYVTSEHAYQADKAVYGSDASAIEHAATPGEAKRLGRKIELRNNWDSYKRAVMLQIQLAKFSQHPELLEKLAATGDQDLVEGNTWGDTYWGAVLIRKDTNFMKPGDNRPIWGGSWIGHNWLGRCIMMARDVLT
jgi:ribA/ribD-fused uncharacterized protein